MFINGEYKYSYSHSGNEVQYGTGINFTVGAYQDTNELYLDPVYLREVT